jgi:hypothetical protein
VTVKKSVFRKQLYESFKEQSYEWGLYRRQTWEVWRCKVCDNLR